MGKSRGGANEKGRAPRKRPLTLAELNDVRKSFADLGVQLDQVATELDDAGFKEVGVDGAAKAEQARRLLQVFIGKVRMGIDEARADR